MNTGQGNKAVMNANLGDTFRVIDYKMDPILTAQSRVIRKQLSFSNPFSNNITLGEYTTVNVVPPSFINNLEHGEYNKVNQILEEIKRNPNALSCTIDKPDGCSWHEAEKEKRFIAHIYVLGEDITSLIQPRGYVWQLWQKGQINGDFTNDHLTDGQTLLFKNDIQLNSNMASNTDSSSDDSSNSSANSYSWSNNDSSPSASSNNYNSDNFDDGVAYFNDNGESYFNYNNSSNADLSLRMSDDSSSSNNSSNDDNNNSDNSNQIQINGNNINEYLTGPNEVVGEVRLLIDTDYISNQQTSNFNTNRIEHLFTINDQTTGTLQYINYLPNQNNYYASSIYYDHNQSHEKNSSHTKFTRLDINGKYQDSMAILFSHNNSNFGLDYTTPGGPYIWTTIQDSNSSDHSYWIVRIPYQAGKVIRLEDIPNNERIMHYNEPSCTIYYDNSSNMVVFSHDYQPLSPNHEVDFYKADDLINHHNNAQPVKKINLVDYGFVPKNEINNNETNSSQQTFQSSCLHYPYYYFDSGDINMSDQRMIYCINVKSGTKIFSKNINLDDLNLSEANDVLGKNPGNYVFAEPETINWISDATGNLWFLYGLNVSYEHRQSKGSDFNSEGIPQPNYTHYDQLYAIGLDINDKNNPSDHSDNGGPNTSGGDTQ